jgi:hypothetical protein
MVTDVQAVAELEFQQSEITVIKTATRITSNRVL